ncbi:MAG: hypothetical protein JXA67_19170 [Micromonosporaceae bacterium]|nr:hypothetical protein [Micromonosporaceae bacterium]
MQPRERLAQEIRGRRRELRLSLREAAKRAGIARNTWSGVEDETRIAQDTTYAGIEAALEWAPGSIEAILAGGNPTPGDPLPETLPPQHLDEPFDLDEELERIQALDLPAHLRLRLMRRMTQFYAQAQAEQRAQRKAAPSQQG